MLIRNRRVGSTRVLLVLLAGLLTTPGTWGKDAQNEPPTSEGFDVLDRFVGPWTLTERHFDAAGGVIATVKGTEEIVWILDKHAIRRTYVSTSDTRRFRAIGLLSWNAASGDFQGTWFDNTANNGPMIVHGQWDPKKNTMVYRYSVPVRKGTAREFNVVERFVDGSTRVATTFEVTGGTVQKRTEVEYKRAAPCPGAKLRMVPDIEG